MCKQLWWWQQVLALWLVGTPLITTLFESNWMATEHDNPPLVWLPICFEFTPAQEGDDILPTCKSPYGCWCLPWAVCVLSWAGVGKVLALPMFSSLFNKRWPIRSTWSNLDSRRLSIDNTFNKNQDVCQFGGLGSGNNIGVRERAWEQHWACLVLIGCLSLGSTETS